VHKRSGTGFNNGRDAVIRTCWNKYYTPSTIEEAVGLLDRYEGQARVVGGGTDLLLEIQQGSQSPVEALVDTSRISGLNTIDLLDEHVVIGGAVTHAQIATDKLLARHAQCLAESCGVIGGPQVRNVATLAGNVAHALPAGDGSIGLLALGGEIEVAGANGSRWMPLQDSFLGPGKSVIDPRRELLTRLRFRPTVDAEGSAFFRVMRPQGVALPMIAMAARIQLGDDDTIGQVRISLGPAGPVPYLAEPAMSMLQGNTATPELFKLAAESLLESISLRSSKYRATLEYRSEMILTHLPLVLGQAAKGASRSATECAVNKGDEL
jgi:carbon-monoxide dehydrogenase medium subunit